MSAHVAIYLKTVSPSESKVEKWETEIKSYYSLSHIFDPDPEDYFELVAQIILLLCAIHKAKYQLFTPVSLIM